MIKRCYCDTETTGTTPKENAIIQWSAKILIDDKEVDSINVRMQPHEGAIIEDTALESNRVTRDQLYTSDRMRPRDAYMEIQSFLGRHCDKYSRTDKYFFLGYKAPFDSDFTREFFKLNNDNYYGSWFWVPPLCIMSLTGHLLQKERAKLENFRLKTVFEYLFPNRGYTEEQWHDALFDIDRTIEVEGAMRDKIAKAINREREEKTKFRNAIRNLILDLRTPPSIAEELRQLLNIEQAELPLQP